MAQAFDISLLGDRELQRQFQQLPLVVQRKLLRQSFRQAMRPVLAMARSLAPKLTGQMARTLRLRAMKRRRGRLGMIIMTAPRAALGIPATAEGYYPAHVEIGAKKRGVPAKPFLRPAFDAQREIMVQTIARGIEEAMRSV